MTSNNILIGLISAIVIVLGITQVAKHNIKQKEHYQDLFYAKDYAKDNWVSRPDFKANLSPRFDSTRVGGGNITGDFPGMSVQGAPVTPVESLINVPSTASPNFASMGGVNGAYADPRLPSGGLTTSQVNDILTQKFGRSSPTYTDTKALLPVPDMKKALAKDPSDPGTFMYDRYLFAPLKRRYPKVNVDFIRGDLAIPQLRMGWFDASPVAVNDLTQGYFSDYLDIQQSTAVKDSIFQRMPSPAQEQTAWGRLGDQTIYSLV